MKSNFKYIIFLTILISVSIKTSFSQLDVVMANCEKHFTKDYFSDGQQYISLISEDQVAEFSVIFYGGNTYRIISGGSNNQDLNFTVYDINRNELFNNANFKNSKYWDIQFKSTIECFIEVKLLNGENNSGFAVLLIGVKK